MVGEDSSAQSNAAQGLAMLQQNSSTALDALISPNTGANPGSSLSFMRGKGGFSINNPKTWNVCN